MAKKLKRKSIDFYSAFYKKPPVNKEQLKRNALFGVPLIVVALILLASGVIYCQSIYSVLKTAEINDYLSDVNIQASMKEAEGLEKEIDVYQKELTYQKDTNKIITSYPQFTNDMFSKIYATATDGTVYTSVVYDAKTGVLTISAEAPKFEYAAKSVAAIRAMNVFSGVQYQGYSSDSKETYIFDIYCIMKGGETP